MIKISMMKQDELKVVADFLARINSIAESHVGFCGTDNQEIAEYILKEIPFTECFFTACVDGELAGVIGYDPDYDSGDAEIWGPFIERGNEHIKEALWNVMTEHMPKGIHSLHLFPNKQNKLVCELAEKQLFERKNDQAILVFHRDNSQLVQDASIDELSQAYVAEMEALHDSTFPNSYYSGKQILERLDEHNKVFIITDDKKLCGYIYVEAEPEHGEASIEFFGVAEGMRGRGIGGQLLATALRWLFSFDTIESISLCVESSNARAIQLYEKVGFVLQHDMYYFMKRI